MLTVPSAVELADPQRGNPRVRDIEPEDLLGREPVQLHEAGIGATLQGRTVLVTGAGGSIGSELCRQVARFITPRLGNVLGSSGSVIPRFKEQIERGGPVTVTHPNIIGYFMTIPEAARLVLQAAAIGESGQVLVLDKGEPVRIVDLARDLIRAAVGAHGGRDSDRPRWPAAGGETVRGVAGGW